MGSVPGLGSSPRGGNGNTLQYSYQDNLMNKESGMTEASEHT